jgi:hypothetical protein
MRREAVASWPAQLHDTSSCLAPSFGSLVGLVAQID